MANKGDTRQLLPRLPESPVAPSTVPRTGGHSHPFSQILRALSDSLTVTKALKEYTPDEAKAIRSGVVKKVEVSDIVPGDVIIVAVGDRIPADCRLLSISSSSFRVDQAILTGESESVNKTLDVVPDEKAVKQDMTNMIFSVRF